MAWVLSTISTFIDNDLDGGSYSLEYNASTQLFVKVAGMGAPGGTIRKLTYKGSGSLDISSTYANYCVIHGANLGDVTITLPQISNIPDGTEFFFGNLSTVGTPYIMYLVTSGTDTIQTYSGAAPGVPIFYSESVHIIGYSTNWEVS